MSGVEKLLTALVAGLLGCLPSVASPDPDALRDATERQIVTAIVDRYAADLELLRRTVDVNSGTLNLKGVRAVGELFALEFERLGFSTRWIDGQPFGRAGHLVAEHQPDADTEAPHFLLIGHLDTVFEADSPFQRFELLDPDETLAKGPGTTDMKGGNVVMLAALHGLKAAGVLDRMRVSVFLAGDEERVGDPLEESRAELLRLASEADFALGFEDGDGDPTTAVITRRGSSRWQLSVRATTAHSSQIFQPEVGAGAVYELARILDAFRRQLSDLEDLTYSPGLVLGGSEVDLEAALSRGSAFGKSNVIPSTAEASGDIRTTSPAQLEEALERMRRIVSESLPGTEATFEFVARYPPMSASDGNRQLLAVYDQASRDLGAGAVTAVDPRNAGAADIAFVAESVEMALDGLGLMGTGGHTIDEVADLETLSSQAARAAVTMLRLQRRQSAAREQ